MISYFNYEIKHNLNETNRIKKLNKKINKNVKKQEIFAVNGICSQVDILKRHVEICDSQEDLNSNKIEFKEITNLIPNKKIDMILNDNNNKNTQVTETFGETILFQEINNSAPKIFDMVVNVNINKNDIQSLNKNEVAFENINNAVPKKNYDMVTNVNNQMTDEIKEHFPNPLLTQNILDEINKVVKKINFNMTVNDNEFLNNEMNNNINNNIVNFKIKKAGPENKTSKIIAPYLRPFTFNIVYQYKYKNKDITGLGDFIRGIYFTLQFSEKYNINIVIQMNNHLIKKHLPYFFNKPNIHEDIANNIPFFDLDNSKYTCSNKMIDYDYIDLDDDFAKFLLNLSDYNKQKYLYTINHPDQKLISKKHIDFIRSILKPSQYINYLIERMLTKLKLVKHHFITIHIRTNDNCFLNKNSLDLEKNMIFLLSSIRNIYAKHKLDILILSSDNKVKLFIANHLNNVKLMTDTITHTCLNDNNEEGLINTLKDFYIMSYSKYIYSFSVYDHGSGFSKWCAMTYNIPYVCYSLEK